MAVDGRQLHAKEMRRLVEMRLDHLVPVREPLVLIGHKGRSGGTLLNQLLDGHPSVHAHPFELEFGRRDGELWPALDLAHEPAHWYERLAERHVAKSFASGYTKGTGRGSEADMERHPFLLPPSLQQSIFHALVEREPPRSPREVLDRFFTSYFNAWLDNQNLYGAAPKRWVVAHRAALAGSREAREAMLSTYPDGRILAPVRDPKGWYASARRLHRHHADDLDAAVGKWLHAAAETLDAARRHPGRVLVIPYEQLVIRTADVMGDVAAWLGIEASPGLLEPTFNRLPIRANSSFGAAGYGIRREPLTAWRHELSARERDRIDALAGDAYRTLLDAPAAGVR
jgi:Sulfotransferase family